VTGSPGLDGFTRMLGILFGFVLLVWLSYRGWTVLVLAPIAALLAAGAAGEPLLHHWTATFMGAAGRFVAQFFPIFLLGAVFGKLLDDSGSATAIARVASEALGARRAVLAGALLTYGGLGAFAAFFVLAPMAQTLFRTAGVPHRLIPAAIALGTSTFTQSALPGSPAVRNAVPTAFFGTNLLAAPGLGLVGAAITLAFGLWWLRRASAAARTDGEGYGDSHVAAELAADDLLVRERATVADAFDPAEIHRSQRSAELPGSPAAVLPLLVVIVVNVLLSSATPAQPGAGFYADEGVRSHAPASGAWALIVALAAGVVTTAALNHRRLPSLRATVDAGANASALPIVSVAGLVGYGAVVTAMPAFGVLEEWILSTSGGPLVSLAASSTLLAALTGSASGGLTIVLEALADDFLALGATYDVGAELLHRVAVMAAGTLDSLPHNGGVVSLIAVCGSTHRRSYADVAVVAIVGPVLALVAVITLGSVVGSF